jgi:hypothetical protein
MASITNTAKIVKALPPELSVIFEGRHGIGKSALVYQIGEALDLPVIERRLGQLTEGDMIGLPYIDNGVSKFAPPEWIKTACNEAVIVFLDEVNRAQPEVMQAAFQIVGSHAINGNVFHPETRVFAAVNNSAEYLVNEMDPAFRDRFWIVELTPTPGEWVKWARKNLNPIIADFIDKFPRHLEEMKNFEGDRVYPSRRSWAKVDRAFKHAGIYEKRQEGSALARGILAGLVGPEAATAFKRFSTEYIHELGALDILNRWDEIKGQVVSGKRTLLKADQILAVNQRLLHHFGEPKVKWTPEQMENLRTWMGYVPDEVLMAFWTEILKVNTAVALQLHKHGKNGTMARLLDVTLATKDKGSA